MNGRRSRCLAGYAPAAVLATVLSACGAAAAVPAKKESPKWEVGIAGGGGWAPHYPAAEQSGGAVAATPYLIYRGQRLRIGEEGLVSGRILETDRVEITASIAGSLPARSKNNEARQGMPDLDALLEAGPQLVVILARRPDLDTLSLKLPIRLVGSTDFSNLKYRGVVVQPRLSYHRENLFGSADLSGSVSVGPIFASERLMDYFYEVAPLYATPDRPAYDARAGYLGSDLGIGLSYKFSKRFSVSVGAQFSYYDGATNEASPLYRSDFGIRVGAGFVWKVWTSKTTVPN